MVEKRRCQICNAVLSSYNPESICYCHQEGMIIKRKVPVTGCTSYQSNERSDDREHYSTVKFPGDDGYNEMAFTEEIVGAIDADGSIYELDLEMSSKGEDVYDNPDQIISLDDLENEQEENYDS